MRLATIRMRINQFIAHAGVCSRRTAEGLIRSGQIRVNGHCIRHLGYQVGPQDRVYYQGKELCSEALAYWLLNKPAGVISSVRDPRGRATVLDLLPAAHKLRLYPVGRLDQDTTGLLLITNHGALTTRLCHPAYQVAKTYRLTLDRPLRVLHQRRLAAGLHLPDGPVQVSSLQGLGARRTRWQVVLHVGKNRIVRRLFAHLGYEVQQLDRVAYGPLTLQGVSRGQCRRLTRSEVDSLTRLVELP